MHSQSILTTIQHIHWLNIMKNYHARHYMWEMAKILVPALLTGLITFIAMRIIDSKNRKRWLNDGHLKRKTELEINIRKFLLGIKGNVPEEYYELADRENEELDSNIIEEFNKDFETLYKYLKTQKQEEDSDIYNDNSIFAFMDEYLCYVPKMQNLFDDFKAMCNNIVELEDKKQEHHKANIYLCFQDVVERILKELTVKKIIK